jgi:hypothetical protein
LGGQRYAPAALSPGKRSDINCTGRWVGPIGIRSPGLPTKGAITSMLSDLAPIQASFLKPQLRLLIINKLLELAVRE